MLLETVNNIRIHRGVWGKGPAPKGGTPTRPFYCEAPNGHVLEDFRTQNAARDYAKRTKDFLAAGHQGSARSGGGAKAQAKAHAGRAAPRIPKIITHANMDPLLDAINADPYFTPEGMRAGAPRPKWLDAKVVLEVPTGELARGGLNTMALVGRATPRHAQLTGKEGFDAQGLEGKVCIDKPLFNALMNMRDLIPLRRGRIVVN